MSHNKIIIVGNLGKDPQLTYSPQGTAICNFSVATNEKDTVKGEKVDITTWFDITLFGRQAEVASQYLTKGKQVYVEGRFRTEEWTDREGKTRVTNKVKGTDMQLIDRVSDGGNGGGGARQAAPQGGGQQAPAPAGGGDVEDEEIPF
ncbi:MAG: single-stranded DNA-binding protein [Pyrinomonadaceae bacterium]